MPPASSTAPWDGLEQEQRFAADRSQVERFLHDVHPWLSCDVHRPQAPVAYTRTTYLDTADGHYLRSRATAVAQRLRIREYAAAATVAEPPRFTGVCYLELKESVGALRQKQRLAAPAEVIWHLVTHGGRMPLAWRAPAAAEPALAAFAPRLRAGLRPCLTTWYRRWSFRDRLGHVRVTLDESIAFCRPCSRAGAAGETAAPTAIVGYGPSRVLEVKHRSEAPPWLRRACAALPLGARRSKFERGMDEMAHSEAELAWMERTQPITLPPGMRATAP